MIRTYAISICLTINQNITNMCIIPDATIFANSLYFQAKYWIVDYNYDYDYNYTPNYKLLLMY